jgi:hypothetical protein
MFLCADCYDPTKAAKRMAKFHEKKLSLFGEEKLAKKITLADLNKEDLANVNLPGCKMLPQKDPNGRRMCYFNVNQPDYDNMDIRIWVRFVMWTALSKYVLF